MALWPSVAGQNVLGIGYTGPYLHGWREQAARCIAVTPRQMGFARWPAGRRSLACLADEDALPFPDLSFDRIVLVHGLEHAENTRRLLRETWRLLADDGKVLAVVPNRRGLWAYSESTPFGQGQPYSEGQLSRLLEAQFFRVERKASALYGMPSEWRPVLRGFALCERYGPLVAPKLGGLTIVEAAKSLHGLMPSKKRLSGRRVLVTDSL